MSNETTQCRAASQTAKAAPYIQRSQCHEEYLQLQDSRPPLQPQSQSDPPAFHMDQKYPELFGSQGASAEPSVFNPCALLPHRSSRVRDLSFVFLGPPTASSDLYSPLGVPHCPAVHAPSFYRAFNSYSRDLYQFREADNLPIPTPPILFDLSGRLISEKILLRFARKGVLFGNMPSSCKDISKMDPAQLSLI